MPTAPANLSAASRASGALASLKRLNMQTITQGAKLPLAAVAGVGIGSLAQGFFAKKGWKLPWNLDVRTVGGVIFLVGGAISRSKYADYYLAAGAGMIVAVLVDATDGIVDKVTAWGGWLADKLSMKKSEVEVHGYDDDGVGSVAGKRRRLQKLETKINRLQGRSDRIASKLGDGNAAPRPSPLANRGGGRMPLQIPADAGYGAGQNVTIPAGQYRRLLHQAGY